ncbi:MULTISPECIES: TioE family transcriptional regulator [Streptomyces]|uniref:MerR family DNA-binding transcriptional regulator n=1 Tax=Streptomyces sudanensis TaxID=436397 RepID=A0ABY4TD93_9ACTN|nr:MULTISPECIES: MerR family DNA-binding transcriptional regulator [Streptomyces]URN16687.1 MerR family DNA-binding transcriptional regulator [Streptomyces sudanensis]
MRTLRPVDLAREHGISTQAVRNHERDGFIPPAERTRSGYRVYTELHAAALRAYLSLVRAYGHATAGQIMTALHHDRLDDALTAVDRGHDQLLRDRQTLDAVRAAVDHLTRAPGAVAGRGEATGAVTGRSEGPGATPGRSAGPSAVAGRSGAPGAAPARSAGPGAVAGRPEVPGTVASRVAGSGPLSVGELARRLRVTPATLRNWEAAGVLAPGRDPLTGHRVFRAPDVRDAELAHLLRRGGHPLRHIATVVRQVRTAGGTDALAAALDDWRGKLTARGLAMLDAAAHLGRYLTLSGS